MHLLRVDEAEIANFPNMKGFPHIFGHKVQNYLSIYIVKYVFCIDLFPVAVTPNAEDACILIMG